ncbi:MAG: hypothetical protein ABSH47_16680 [Bryobacteraceae bacterium]|jgi:hypothetical protein
MYKAALVERDLTLGAEIVRILDEAGLRIKVALWVNLDEFGDWRLLLASREFDKAGPRGGYRLLREALEGAGIAYDATPIIMIFRMEDQFIRTLRRIFGKAASVEGMRLGGQMIGSRSLDEAYVYRIS